MAEPIAAKEHAKTTGPTLPSTAISPLSHRGIDTELEKNGAMRREGGGVRRTATYDRHELAKRR